jgi:hypothetical protein
VSLSAREREGERERREREREKRESNYVWPKMCTRHFKEFLHAPSTRGAPAPRPRRHHAQTSPAARGASAPTRGEQNFYGSTKGAGSRTEQMEIREGQFVAVTLS